MTIETLSTPKARFVKKNILSENPVMVIVGIPNVGKSTLFNRLSQKRAALVFDQEGVTRDWKKSVITLSKGKTRPAKYKDAGLNQTDADNSDIYQTKTDHNKEHQKDSIDVILIDTAGIGEFDFDAKNINKDDPKNYILSLAQKSTKEWMKKAVCILWIVDGSAPLTREDIAIVDELRPYRDKTVPILNKGEKKNTATFQQTWTEIYEFGFKLEPIIISALHGLDVDLLERFLYKQAINYQKKYLDHQIKTTLDMQTIKITEEKKSSLILHQGSDVPQSISTDPLFLEHRLHVAHNVSRNNTLALIEEPLMETQHRPISIAIIGRPNVGKSTLMNNILGYQRSLTSDYSGTTTDVVDEEFIYDNRHCVILDTAGIRKKFKHGDNFEQLMIHNLDRTLGLCDIVLFVLDATQALERQDWIILEKIQENGCGLVVVVNKWDLVEKRQKNAWKDWFFQKSTDPFLMYAPCLFLSALKQEARDTVLIKTLQVMARKKQQLSTGSLNKWLSKITDIHAFSDNKNPIKLKYMVQKKARVPTFSVHGTRVDLLHEHQVRFLTKKMYQEFDFDGVPLRFDFFKNENPYHQEEDKVTKHHMKRDCNKHHTKAIVKK